MRQRPLALSVVLSGCLLAAVALANSHPQAFTQDSEQLGPRRPFIHKDHVPQVWTDGSSQETARDCRGCHVFSKDGTRDPQGVCANCHIQALENGNRFQAVFSEGWETLDKHRDPDGMFQHDAHLDLACRECHQPDDKIPTDPMPIRRGSHTCIRCHGPAVAGESMEFEVLMGASKLDSNRARGSMLELLNTSPSMLPKNTGGFVHPEHLGSLSQGFSLEELLAGDSQSGVCTSCHEPIVSSDEQGLHGTRFQQANCGVCHITQSAPMEFEMRVEQGTSLTEGTFSHADHLKYDPSKHDPKLSNAEGYRRIEESGCHACHGYNETAQTFKVERAGTHQDCRTCHDDEMWNARQHGDWEGWGCVQCHSFEDQGALALDRPAAIVKRRSGIRFLVESQVHPHIAGQPKTQVYKGNCVQCHRAPVKELPSRIGQRAFDHGTHLPENPTPQLCARCHDSRVTQAQTSLALGEAMNGIALVSSDPLQNAQLGLTFDMGVCNECHRGGISRAAQTQYASLESHSVPEFSHAFHLGKEGPDGRGIDCLSCHQPGTQPGSIVGTLTGAKDCTQCHDHEDGYASSITGQASAVELARCANCHGSSIPRAGGGTQVERLRLGQLLGQAPQYHPSDRKCAECHKSDLNLSGAEFVVGGDHVFAVGGRSTLPSGDIYRHQHRGRGTDGELLAIPDSANGFLRNRAGLDCLWCHWTSGIPSFDFENESNRRKKGNLFEKVDKEGREHIFPGGNYSGLFGKAVR